MLPGRSQTGSNGTPVSGQNGFFYDELDSEDKPRDFTILSAKTNVSFKPLDKLKIIPSFQGAFNLYQNQEKTQAVHTFGLIITSTINNVRVGGKYKKIPRLPLGEQSTVLLRFNYSLWMTREVVKGGAILVILLIFFIGFRKCV